MFFINTFSSPHNHVNQHLKTWYGRVQKLLLPITRRQILDSSKLREFADDNFKFDESGRKYLNR